MRLFCTWCVVVMMGVLAGCSAAPAEFADGGTLGHGAAVVGANTFAAKEPSNRGGDDGVNREAVITADAASIDQAPALRRLIIYNAAIAMVVPDIRATQQLILRLASDAGGYLQEIDGNNITVRVPAATFQPTIGALEKLGDVTHQQIKANDVTEEMRDLQIRLENAEHVRDRLAELVAKSTRMEDTIKLEQELERVTQTIELLKGKIQYMQSQVAFSTIRVDLDSPRPQTQMTAALPFPWVRDLGDGAVAGTSEPMADTSRFWKRNERFALPAGFVRYFERDYVTEAMSADEIVIKLKRQDNYDGGEIGFWSGLARKALVENRAIAVSEEKEAQVRDGTAAHVIIGIKDFGPRKEGYLLGIAATKRYVYTFEAWGDAEKMRQQMAALEKAFGTLDVKHW